MDFFYFTPLMSMNFNDLIINVSMHQQFLWCKIFSFLWYFYECRLIHKSTNIMLNIIQKLFIFTILQYGLNTISFWNKILWKKRLCVCSFFILIYENVRCRCLQNRGYFGNQVKTHLYFKSFLYPCSLSIDWFWRLGQF